MQSVLSKTLSMNTEKLYQDILGLVSLIRNDEDRLLEVINFLENQQLSKHHIGSSIEIPEECRDPIIQISEALENGFICFLNPETLEIEQVDRSTYFQSEDFEEQNDDKLDEFDLSYMGWNDYIRFEPLNLNEVYLVMEKYVAQRNDGELTRCLENSLSDERPVISFLEIIKDNDLEESWLSYKRQATTEYVTARLLNELRLKSQLESE